MPELPPKRAAFVKAYTDPTAPTFGNGTQSAVAAGYQQSPGAVAVEASRLLKNDKVQSEVQRALAAAGITREHLARGMRRYFDDEDQRVRASSVRAGEILMRAAGMLQPDTQVTIDARSILLPGSAEASVAQLEAALAALDVTTRDDTFDVPSSESEAT